MTSEIKKQIRAKGILKCIIGLIMMVIIPLVTFIGLIAKFIGAVCIIAGAAIKAFEVFAQHNKEKRMFWKERTENFMHFGGVAFLGGLVMTIPYLANVIAIIEGLYNAIKLEDKYNSVEFLDKAAKFFARFVSNFKTSDTEKHEKNKQENFIDAKIIEEKPTKNPEEEALLKKTTAKKKK